MSRKKQRAACAYAAVILAASPISVFAAAGTNDDCVNNGVQGSPFPAGSGSVTVTGGQVSGAGATLFVDFFLAPASTNDWIDADNDGQAGFFNVFPFVDNLSANWTPGGPTINTHWMFQYRSVGSVNGFNEFVESQTCNAIPLSIPSERGIFNQFSYATGGSTTWGGPFANSSGTPVQPCEIEFAFLDVPSAWAVQVDGEGACQPGGAACNTDGDCESSQKCVGGPKWNAKPTATGYGRNPIVSSTGYVSNLQTLGRECGNCANSGDPCTAQKHCAAGACSISGTTCRSDLNCPAGTCSITVGNACRVDLDCPMGETCQNAQTCNNLEVCNLSGNVSSLNSTLNDNDTIYDFVGAWVPVAYISNRGTGVQDVKYSEMQYLFVTGRMPNGENLIGVTRSVGSGTRNAIMNSTGIDTSWGRGDNLGNEAAVNAGFNAGPNTQPTNGEGSGNVELAVQSRRLAVGYTGLGGGSRAVQDVRAGLYEILNLCKDVDEDGNPLCDCTPQACAAGPRECSGGGSGDACVNDGNCPAGQTCQEIDDVRANNGYVRPKLDTVLDNCDACCGYTIGGNGSFVTRGDPRAVLSGNPPLNNLAVRDYLLNIEDATLDFSGAVNSNLCLNTGSCSVTVATACRVGFDADCPMGETCLAKTCTNNSQCTQKTCSESIAACVVDGDCPNVAQTCDGGNCSISAEVCVVDGDCSAVVQTCRADICRSNLNSPGQFLATTFFLPPAIDCQQSLADGMDFSTATPNLNQSLQNYIRNTSNLGAGGDTPDYGTINPATGGRVPTRNALTGGINYSDGSVSGSFTFWNGASFTTSLTGSAQLSVRNRLQGDFNEDLSRDINDADELVKAYYIPRTWQRTDPQAQGTGSGAALGGMTADNAIPEVIGDFNGDGSLTKEDLRYFADGLAITDNCAGGANAGNDCVSDGDCPGSRCGLLNRKSGAIAIDTAIASWGRCADDLTVPCRANVECTDRGLAGPCDLAADYFPWADPAQSLYILGIATGQDPKFNLPKDVNDAGAPMLVTGAAYDPGDFRADVAGASPTAGAHPRGWDGFVDEQDIDYCCRSVRAGSWSNINQAVYMDLSCDMTGDLDVNFADIKELVEEILETSLGDVNLDGMVDAADRSIIEASIAGNPCNMDGSCGWADGDSNCDGFVNAADGLLPPEPEPAGTQKVRFISFVVPTTTAGTDTAIRVQLTTLHDPSNPPAGTPDFSAFEGGFRYVNSFSGTTVCVDNFTFLTNYRCGQLGCQPEYRDWGTDLASATNPASPAGIIHVTGDAVAPSSTLTVSNIAASCGAAPSANTCAQAAGALALTTSRWGDVAGSGGGPPDGIQNVIDIGSVVDNVKGLPTAIVERRAWMKNPTNAVGNPVNVIDIGLTVDSVKGFPYPYTIAACP